jgi:uncharacterized Zn-binding protein involved in type VI secretion
VLWLADGARQWERLADLPLPCAFAGSAIAGGSVFALGDGAARFDPARRVFEVLAPEGSLPQSHFAACALGDAMHVIGGFPVARSGHFVVDARTGKVAQGSPPPDFAPGDHFHFVAALGGELHVVGGLAGDTFAPRRSHHVLREGQWRTLPQPPAGLWAKFGGQAVVGGCLHVFGEFGHHRFDPRTGSWETRSPLPFLLVMPAVTVLDGTIWLVGGMRVEGAGDVLLAYDPERDTWRDGSAAR